MARNKNEKAVPDEDVKISSFEVYESSDDDTTKIVDGEKVIKDFHLYEEDDGDDIDEDEEEDDDDESDEEKDE